MVIKVLSCDTARVAIISDNLSPHVEVFLKWIIDTISFHIHFHYDISFTYFLWHDTEDDLWPSDNLRLLSSIYLENKMTNQKLKVSGNRFFWFNIHPTLSLLRTGFTTRLVYTVAYIQLYIYVCYLKVKSKCLKTYFQIGFYKLKFIKLKSIGIKGLFQSENSFSSSGFGEYTVTVRINLLGRNWSEFLPIFLFLGIYCKALYETDWDCMNWSFLWTSKSLFGKGLYSI